MSALPQGERLLRLREVMATTGLGSSTIYRHIQAGTFPAPVKIGGTTSRWRSSELADWMNRLVHSECSSRSYGVRDGEYGADRSTIAITNQ